MACRKTGSSRPAWARTTRSPPATSLRITHRTAGSSSGSPRPDIMEPVAKKAALRVEMQGLRAGLDPALGARLTDHVIAAGIIPPGAVVAGYWPMPHEIDISPLLLALHERSHALCLPETTRPGEALIFRAWKPGAKMVQGRYNTQHPEGAEMVP